MAKKKQPKLTPAQAIIANPDQLWLNTPVGYPYAERIHQNDIGNIKSFLIKIFVGAGDVPGGDGDAIRQATQEELIDTCLNNGWTFDPEWFGYRPIPTRPDGNPISALDDPEWRRSRGIGNF